MIARSIQRVSPFVVACWAEGASGFTDADPNVTPPAASRIVTMPKNALLWSELGSNTTRSGLSLWLFMADGTSLQCQAHYYDEGARLWVPFQNSQGLTTSLPATTTNLVREGPGLKCFVRITANVGVTKFAYFFR